MQVRRQSFHRPVLSHCGFRGQAGRARWDLCGSGPRAGRAAAQAALAPLPAADGVWSQLPAPGHRASQTQQPDLLITVQGLPSCGQEPISLTQLIVLQQFCEVCRAALIPSL